MKAATATAPVRKPTFSAETKLVIGAFSLDFLAWGIIDPFFSIFVQNLLHNVLLVGLVFALRGLVALLSLGPMSEIISRHGSRG